MALTPSLGAGIDGKMAINLSDSIQTITSPVQSIIGGDLVLIGWRKESCPGQGVSQGVVGCSTVVWTRPRPPEPLSPVGCCTQRLQLGSAEHCGSVREAQRRNTLAPLAHNSGWLQESCTASSLSTYAPTMSQPVPCSAELLVVGWSKVINGAEDLHSNDAGRAHYCYLHLRARDMQEPHNAKRTCPGCSKGQGGRSDWQIDKGALVRSHP